MAKFNVMFTDAFTDFEGRQYEKGVLLIKLSSWNDFSRIVQKFHNNKDYIWRGQRRENWALLSNFDRLSPARNRRAREDNSNALCTKFSRAIMGRRGNNPPELDADNVWALGRHYGLVTPILDWTESPYVAAFFAFCEKEEYEGISQDTLNNLKQNILGALENAPSDEMMIKFEAEFNIRFPTGNRAVYALNKDLVRWYQPSGGTQAGRETLVRFIEPGTEENARMIAQRGLFTYSLHSEDIVKRVKKCYSARQDENRVILIKITIPNRDREECLKSLDQMNINHLTLFPDLHGAAMYSNLSLEIGGY